MSEAPRADRRKRLTARLARGLPVDWDTEERAARTDDERGTIRQLRVIAAMSAVNAGLQSAQPDPTLEGASASLAVGTRWGPLEIEARIGSGSFGEVYRARDVRLDREVALKLLTRDAGSTLGETVAEARLLARIRHPHVVTVYGAEHIDGRVGIWMELVRGETLTQALSERGPFDVADLMLVGIELARALSAVHAAGVVHQDVKLGNVMRASDGRIVLMDFGLGREIAPPLGMPTPPRLAGTPLFMAPEVLRGRRADPRSDLYSMGVVLFALATGRLPIESSSIAELCEKQARSEISEARDLRPDLPPALAEILRTLLHPDPDLRFGDAGQVEQAFLSALSMSALSGEGVSNRRGPRPPRAGLPRETDTFFGRSDDLVSLAETFERGSRLVTILGPAGMGKSRLALHYARKTAPEWPGSVWFCDATDAKDRGGVSAAVAAALGVPLAHGSMDQLGHAICARGRCLVILDNFDQVAGSAQEILGPWFDRCPEASFVVTSRVRLGLREETVLLLEPLSVDAGLALYRDRARRQRSTFELTEPELEAARELIGILEGMPLAIELAAARTRVMTAPQLVARLRSRLNLLRGGERGRHETLRAAIAGSWDLLTPWEQAALAQCAVFEGGFGLEAAEAVIDLARWPEAPWVVDVIQSLVDKSLLRTWSQAPSNQAEATTFRFGMFAAIQEFAREQLASDPDRTGDARESEANSVDVRHGRWFSGFGSDAALRELNLRGGVEKRRSLALDIGNLTAACRRAIARVDEGIAVPACRAACAVIELRGPYAAAVELATKVAELSLTPGARSRLLVSLALAEQRLGRKDLARGHLEEALVLFREARDRQNEGTVLARLGTLPLNLGQLDEAQPILEAALAIHREVGSRFEEGVVLGNLGLLHHERGAFDVASSHLEAALLIHREVGNVRSEGVVLGNLGNLRSYQKRVDEARRDFEAALEVHRRVGNRRFEGIVLGNLGTLCMDLGAFDDAEAHLLAALAIHRDVGARDFEGITLGNLGDLAYEVGRFDEGRSHYEAALAIGRENRNQRHSGILLGALARIDVEQGLLEEASARLSEGERLLRESDQPAELAKLIATRAEIARLAERSRGDPPNSG